MKAKRDNDMEGKINRDYLKSYSVSYTNNILDTAFKEGPHLAGRDLTTLCTPEQVNYNLLKNIFLQWEAELSKLESPYFDYKAPAVQTALKTFMDVLSRHIKLDQGSLRPLLQQAVEETMHQVFQPEYYYQHFIWPDGSKSLKTKELINLKRFVRVNRGLLLELIDEQAKENKDSITEEEFYKFIEQNVLQWQNQWDSVDVNVEAFSKVIAMQVSNLWKKEAVPVAPKENGSTKNVNERYAKKVVSLNDKLQKDQNTLADQHLNKKVQNIKESLTINQKFMFVNELFAGDSQEFGTVLEKIEKCGTYIEAVKIIDDNSSGRSQWDMESTAVKELLDLVSRRF